jgi:hypothetical protein
MIKHVGDYPVDPVRFMKHGYDDGQRQNSFMVLAFQDSFLIN